MVRGVPAPVAMRWGSTRRQKACQATMHATSSTAHKELCYDGLAEGGAVDSFVHSIRCRDLLTDSHAPQPIRTSLESCLELALRM